ncbi:MAG: hypothetical protein GY795_46570, partial [Desulfobacterales bacterium]|nr:hypothetical protein [Desulfobacterales bacterium]
MKSVISLLLTISLLLSGVQNCGYGRNSSPTTPLSAAAEAGLPEGTYPEKPSPCYEITHVHTDYDGNSNVT